MPNSLSYWYNDAFPGSSFSQLPAQAIPLSKKNEDFKAAVMDSLERIGIKQLRENLKFKDLYRMIEGKLSYSELSEVIPHLSQLEDKLKDAHIPSFLKHYDILGIIIRAMRGEYISNIDKFTVVEVDEIASNEYLREKTDYLQKYIADKWNKELELRLISRGLIPEGVNAFNSEEEKQQYIQQVEQTKNELTPPEIEMYMKTNWQTQAVKWAQHTLEADTERFRMTELDLQNLTDYLLTGRCFRHFRVGYDSYEPEAWSPLNTFYSQNLDIKYPQEGDYIGRIHYYSASQVVSKYGNLLTREEKEKILNTNRGFSNGYNYGSGEISLEDAIKTNFGRTEIVPFEQYYDYEFMLNIQEAFGLPMAKRTIYHKDGSEEVVDSFLPKPAKSTLGSFSQRAYELSDNKFIRRDLLQVTEAYFVSYSKFALITFEDPETGRLTQETVTEEILSDFLKENNIKSVRNVTVSEAEKNPEPNTIVWDYSPEIWGGVKINNANTKLEKPLYLKVEPLEYQIKGNSKLYQLELPVAGLIDVGVAPLILPYQIGHNIAMNQMYNLLEKELGLFFLFDIQFLPSEFKDWGDTTDTLLHMKSVIKDTGLLPLDSTRSNLQGAAGFAQFAPQNMSYSAQISDRMNLAEFYKNKAFEQIGFNPQRLGAPTKYETEEGVKTSQKASYSQTEPYFEKFSDFKRRALDMHLVVAQYSQKNNKDISVFYTKSDASIAWLKFSDPNFSFRRFGIMVTSNGSKRKTLEQFKQFVLQNNTMGNDLLSLAQVVSSETMNELIEVARFSRQYQERLEKQKSDGIMQQQKQLHDQQIELMEKQWELDEVSKQADRETKLEEERISALGRAADKKSDAEGINMINRQTDLALKQKDMEFKQKLDERRSVIEDVGREDDIDMKNKELQLKTKQLEEKINQRLSNERIALINKN